MRKVKLLLFVVLAVVFAASTGFAAEKSFKAKLTPKEETKKPKSKASGKAEFKLSEDGKSMTYKLHVKNIMDPTAAHIHMGKKGADGPPVVGLASEAKKGKVSGVLSEGMIMDKDLMGDLQGKTVADLVNLIKSGDAYVNVHSSANPDGEIRGQIK
ncbi:MAG TPA: CHRD domain-containing protein [Geomonas sp.]